MRLKRKARTLFWPPLHDRYDISLSRWFSVPLNDGESQPSHLLSLWMLPSMPSHHEFCFYRSGWGINLACRIISSCKRRLCLVVLSYFQSRLRPGCWTDSKRRGPKRVVKARSCFKKASSKDEKRKDERTNSLIAYLPHWLWLSPVPWLLVFVVAFFRSEVCRFFWDGKILATLPFLLRH